MMQDVDYPLRVAVIAKLRNNVTWDGHVVPVKGAKVAPEIPTPYIYIPTQYNNNDSAKNDFATDNTIHVEIVTRSEVGTDLQVQLDNISNQVMNILVVKDQIDMPQPAGLGMVDFEFESGRTISDFNVGTGHDYLRKVLIFNALVDEG